MSFNYTPLLAIFFSVYVITSLFMYSRDNLPVITFIDVGQGDSVLLEYLDSGILIDGGPDLSVNAYIDSFKFFPICNFDYIFITHPHSDHVFGFTKLLERCTFKKLFFNNPAYESKLITNFVRNLNDSSKKISNIKMGDTIMLGDMTLYILWPDWNYRDLISQNPNDESVVILVDYKNFEVLLTGDAEVEVLSLILKNNKKLFSEVIDGRLEILKVSHHGALNALYPDLYMYLDPKFCIISVGQNNSYGHPNQKTIDFLDKDGCEILRTDFKGNIIFKLE